MKPKIAVVMAEIMRLGWLVGVYADPPGCKAGSLAIAVFRGTMEEPETHSVIVWPGDDEQLRAALQSLLHEIGL